jgi:hypothetical protein
VASGRFNPAAQMEQPDLLGGLGALGSGNNDDGPRGVAPQATSTTSELHDNAAAGYFTEWQQA